MIRARIYYKGNLRRDLVFDTPEEDGNLRWYIKQYGLDLDKDFMSGERINHDWYWFYIPVNKKLYGIEDDDRNLEIEKIIIEPFLLKKEEKCEK